MFNFNKKQIKKLEKDVESLENTIYGYQSRIYSPPPGILGDITDLKERIKEIENNKVVECKTCGCLIKKEDRFAVKVEQDTFSAEMSINNISCGDYEWTYEPVIEKEYYCLIHKPPYDRKIGDKYYKDNIEVDNKGRIKKSNK